MGHLAGSPGVGRAGIGHQHPIAGRSRRVAPGTIGRMRTSSDGRDLVLAATIVIGLSRFVDGELPWAIPALAVVAWFLGRTLSTELRLAGSTTPPSSADRAAVLTQALVAAFGAFIGIEILARPGLPITLGATTPPASIANLAVLAIADGLIAFLLAYRISALRSSNLRDV